MHDLLKRWEPARGEWDEAAAAHLLRRAAFCAPPDRIRETLGRAPHEEAAAIVRGPERDEPCRELESIEEAVRGLGQPDAVRSWLLARMVRCEHQLREKMALFWHGHFATSIQKVRNLDWMFRQYRLFLDRGLGRFALLLDGVARSPAMIRWLDNESNRKGHANENFARELLELFTLGDGNYTERDIQEAARAFTGWHILRDRFHFSARLHDDGEKTVLGTTGPLSGEDVLAIALGRPACARFLSGKLLRFFAEPDPPAEVVEGFASVLRERDLDIGASLRVLFSSRYFFAPGLRGALVKSPCEFVAGAARVLGFRPDAGAMVERMREMGQDLLAPPNVKGWPGDRAWINTATWLARVNAAFELAGRHASALDRDRAAKERSFLGRPADTKALGGTGNRDLVHALLSLPEAHLT